MFENSQKEVCKKCGFNGANLVPVDEIKFR